MHLCNNLKMVYITLSMKMSTAGTGKQLQTTTPNRLIVVVVHNVHKAPKNMQFERQMMKTCGHQGTLQFF